MSKYRDQVRAAAAALKRGEDANLELGRLTFEACGPKSGQGGWQARVKAGFISLERWAHDVALESGRNFGSNTAAYYRDVWVLFQTYPGKFASWSEAYVAVRGGTVGERMVEADFARAMANASFEQKREHFATFVQAEPQVVTDALRDDRTRWSVDGYSHQVHREKYPELDMPPPRLEVRDSTLDRRIFYADIATKVTEWTRELNEIRDFLDWSGDVDRQRRWATRQALERLVQAAIACRDVLPSTYVDAEVSSELQRKAIG